MNKRMKRVFSQDDKEGNTIVLRLSCYSFEHKNIIHVIICVPRKFGVRIHFIKSLAHHSLIKGKCLELHLFEVS